LLVVASPASAHATLVTSDPLDGARLHAVPAAVTLTFDESVGLGSLGYLTVTDEAGRRVDTGGEQHPGGNGAKVSTRLLAGLGDGTYTESYRVVSADGHPITGVVRFVVGDGALVVSGGTNAATDGGTSAMFAVARWLSYAGLALLGGAWLLLTAWTAGQDARRARAVVWTGWGLAVAGAVGEMLLQGPYVAGSGLGSITRWSLLDATLGTSYGQYHAIRLILLGLVALALAATWHGRFRSGRDVLGLLGIGVAFTFSASGHAETTDPRWLSITADIVHLLSMAAWLGGLVMILVALLPGRDPSGAELRAVLPVFSRVATVAVGLIAVTGLYAAFRGVGLWRAVIDSRYGLLVDTKIILLGLILVIALTSRSVVNRWRVSQGEISAEVSTPGDARAVEVEQLRRGVLVEAALAVLVLAATSVLVDTPRGREAIAVSDAKPVSGVANLGNGRAATVGVDPGKHGNVVVDLTLTPGTAATKVVLTAAQPDRKLGPIPVPLTAAGADHYTSGTVNLPVSGGWTFALVVTTSAFDATSTDVTISLH
jgi:copper transport protein